jgi:hypothetical protein
LAVDAVVAVVVAVAGALAVVLVDELVLLVDVCAGGGSVPIGCESHDGTPGELAAFVPAYLETNSATSLASCPTTTFWGMIAPEKPPFSIA